MRNERPLAVRSHYRDREASRGAADHFHGRDVDADPGQIRPDTLAIGSSPTMPTTVTADPSEARAIARYPA